MSLTFLPTVVQGLIGRYLGRATASTIPQDIIQCERGWNEREVDDLIIEEASEGKMSNYEYISWYGDRIPAHILAKRRIREGDENLGYISLMRYTIVFAALRSDCVDALDMIGTLKVMLPPECYRLISMARRGMASPEWKEKFVDALITSPLSAVPMASSALVAQNKDTLKHILRGNEIIMTKAGYDLLALDALSRGDMYSLFNYDKIPLEKILSAGISDELLISFIKKSKIPHPPLETIVKHGRIAIFRELAYTILNEQVGKLLLTAIVTEKRKRDILLPLIDLATGSRCHLCVLAEDPCPHVREVRVRDVKVFEGLSEINEPFSDEIISCFFTLGVHPEKFAFREMREAIVSTSRTPHPSLVKWIYSGMRNASEMMEFIMKAEKTDWKMEKLLGYPEATPFIRSMLLLPGGYEDGSGKERKIPVESKDSSPPLSLTRSERRSASLLSRIRKMSPPPTKETPRNIGELSRSHRGTTYETIESISQIVRPGSTSIVESPKTYYNNGRHGPTRDMINIFRILNFLCESVDSEVKAVSRACSMYIARLIEENIARLGVSVGSTYIYSKAPTYDMLTTISGVIWGVSDVSREMRESCRRMMIILKEREDISDYSWDDFSPWRREGNPSVRQTISDDMIPLMVEGLYACFSGVVHLLQLPHTNEGKMMLSMYNSKFQSFKGKGTTKESKKGKKRGGSDGEKLGKRVRRDSDSRESLIDLTSDLSNPWKGVLTS